MKFASAINLTENAKISSSTGYNPDSPNSHVVPGDTVYYEVDMETPRNKNNVCTFTVNGTQIGR